MKSSTLPELACRYCKHYVPEGRRGGICGQLGVFVQGQWAACRLVLPTLGALEPLADMPLETQAATEYSHA
jgi:hypothetical protein